MNDILKIVVFSLFVLTSFFIPNLKADEVNCDEIISNIEDAKIQADKYSVEQEKLLAKLDRYNTELDVDKYDDTGQTINENFTNCLSSSKIGSDFCEVIHEKYFDVQNKKRAIYAQARVIGDNASENQSRWAEYINIASNNNCYKYKK